jgi:hypothetical protein
MAGAGAGLTWLHVQSLVSHVNSSGDLRGVQLRLGNGEPVRLPFPRALWRRRCDVRAGLGTHRRVVVRAPRPVLVPSAPRGTSAPSARVNAAGSQRSDSAGAILIGLPPSATSLSRHVACVAHGSASPLSFGPLPGATPAVLKSSQKNAAEQWLGGSHAGQRHKQCR